MIAPDRHETNAKLPVVSGSAVDAVTAGLKGEGLVPGGEAAVAVTRPIPHGHVAAAWVPGDSSRAWSSLPAESLFSASEAIRRKSIQRLRGRARMPRVHLRSRCRSVPRAACACSRRSLTR